METQELPLSLVKSIPVEDLQKILDTMRSYLKNHDKTLELFDEYEVSIEELNYIPMMFDDIDVSAKTSKGIIIFSYALLQDADFFEDYSYAQHELTHWLQQCTGEKPTRTSEKEDYLQNENEVEGFQNQIEFIHHEQGPEEAEEYVEDLLEYHDKSGKEKEKIKKTLTKNI